MLSIQALTAMPTKAYAGIGSRETPRDALALMTRLAGLLGGLGFRLRTGGADGADTAFEHGAPSDDVVDLFLPWPGFNARSRAARNRPKAPDAFRVAAGVHPHWERLNEPMRALHARNAHQVLGDDLKTPAAFVLCWTADGATELTTVRTGGTGQAIRLAASLGLPVWNLARPNHRSAWEALL
jgi:hypothetical protein